MSSSPISPNFTLESAVLGVVGGVIIAVSTSIHLLVRGRITGISGIAQAISSISLAFSRRTWRVAFLTGIAAGAGVMAELLPAAYAADPLDPTLPVAAVGGLLVGVGTKLGSGCTSGHGVCGLPRFSKRSFVSVATFCSVGAGVAVTMSASGVRAASSRPDEPLEDLRIISLLLALFTALLLLLTAKRPEGRPSIRDRMAGDCFEVLLSFTIGLLFAVGLSVSGMTRPSRVIGFLDVASGWDPTLAFVLLSAVTFNIFAFRAILARAHPVAACEFELPCSKHITPELVVGATIFGAGWGLTGLCPGPAICLLASGKTLAFAWAVPFFFGQAATERVQTAVAEHRAKQTAAIAPVERDDDDKAGAAVLDKVEIGRGGDTSVADTDAKNKTSGAGDAVEWEGGDDDGTWEVTARDDEGELENLGPRAADEESLAPASSLPPRMDPLGRVLRKEMSESGIRRHEGHYKGQRRFK